MSGVTETPRSVLNGQSALNIPGGLLGSRILISALFEIIFKRLHPLFSIECVSLLIYDDKQTVIKEAFTSNYLIDTEKVSTEVISQPSELTALQKLVAEFSYPVLKTDDEWLEDEHVNHLPVNSTTSYKYHCYIPLEISNHIIGTLELHNNHSALSTECLTFCSSMADLFADLIWYQRQQPVQASPPVNGNNTISGQKENSNQDMFKLVDQLNSATTFDEFFNDCAKLFPLAHEKIKSQLNEINNYKKLADDVSLHVEEAPYAKNNYPDIIGSCRSMQRVFNLIDQVADSESTVLILGATGTGKELIAKAIHEGSVRKDCPLIKVNCAAIPANLIESELFGHEKGSFTGATDKRIGKFELANNGTLFLDEIGELPLDLQVKLLRALQEKEIERVGGKTVIKCNVRVISATNRDLFIEVEKGRFRKDLYFRLNVFPIALPALSERTEDIPLLATHFLTKYANKANKKITGFTKGAIRQMCNYNWPGNVREMEHLIERQVLLNHKPVISEIDIPTVQKTMADKRGILQKVKTIDENERDHIFDVLQLCKGRISGPDGAAKLLGIPATTLNSKIKRLGLNKKHF